MSYAGAFLRSQGTEIAILRNPQVATKVSIKPDSKGIYSGLALSESNLKAGEIFSIDGEKYLVQSSNKDLSSGELEIATVKTNVVVSHQRYIEDADDNGNIIQEWHTLNSAIDCHCIVITAALKQFEPGILEGTKYIIHIPAITGVILLDRIILDGQGYRVDSIDNVAAKGITKIQLGSDTRA